MTNFLNLISGHNNIRIITPPYQYICHPDYIEEGEVLYGMRYPCSTLLDPNSCKLCINERYQYNWLLGVISRSDNKYYLLNIDYHTMRQVQILAQSFWDNPNGFDVSIYADDRGHIDNKRVFYVIPLSKSDLSTEESTLVDSSELIKLSQPHSPIKNPKLITNQI